MTCIDFRAGKRPDIPIVQGYEVGYRRDTIGMGGILVNLAARVVTAKTRRDRACHTSRDF